MKAAKNSSKLHLIIQEALAKEIAKKINGN